MTARVVIADDHGPMRAGVRRALESDGRFEVCGEAASAPAAVEMVRMVQPDVVLLDIRMPGNGIAAAYEISTESPDTAIVMLTVSRDDNDLFAALSAGARGYLLKDIDPDRLPRALEGVLAGEAALPRNLVAKVVEEFRVREAAASRRRGGPLAALTDREWEVLTLMRGGLSTQEIATRLFVTPVTVRTHVSAILRKLKVSDRTAAIALVRDA
ncbi:MAG TPA: response regulator transcription factor [Mycobacteriales bacterium]|nr:response regulator transcription factor [Mycobacteriales bacterium]